MSPDNTNATKLTQTGLGPYFSRAANVYRCPSDHVLSSLQRDAGWTERVRSYSMNAMVGDAGNFTQTGVNVNNPDYIQFFTLTAIPQPSEIFVFLDEHPDSINDGYFLDEADDLEWIDLPASYHDGAGNFSFADGHSETHRWLEAGTKRPARPDAAQLPFDISPAERRDFDWLAERMSVERN